MVVVVVDVLVDRAGFLTSNVGDCRFIYPAS